MVKQVAINIDGTKFMVQQGLSFVQQSKLIGLIEGYLEFDKLREMQETKTDLNMEDMGKILKKGVNVTEFTFALAQFFLLTLVKSPKITEKRLNNPDDPLVGKFYMLGIELSKLGMEYLGKLMSLKKTPS